MKPLFARWLSVMLTLCLLLSLAPAALMEEMPEAQDVVVEEAAPTVVGEDQAEPAKEATEPVADDAAEPASDDDAEPDADAPVPNEDVEEVDVEIASEPVDAVVEESEDAELVDLPVLEAQSDEGLDLETSDTQGAEVGGGNDLLFDASVTGVAINATNFPDDRFRAYVSENLDCGWSTWVTINGEDVWQTFGVDDGFLSPEEIENVAVIDVADSGIKSLAGIKIFQNLLGLYCDNNQLTALDVSGCTGLYTLECCNNQLTTLDVSGCTGLEYLYCDDNQLTTLDVSACTGLYHLWCYNNQLTTLDVSGCTALVDISCHNNQLTTLDVSGYTELYHLSCDNNQLTTLNVSSCTGLENFYCCYNNQLTALDVSGCTGLYTLECHDNQLTTLDVSGCTGLEYLSCNNNQLTVLDVSSCTGLTTLYCGDNQLTTLDVSGFTRLEKLWCSNNQLTTLDVSGFTRLEELWCENNQLTTLDVSACTGLYQLWCENNQLTTLDVSGCTGLYNLDCYNNQLTRLDLNHCPVILDRINSANTKFCLFSVNSCGYTDGDIFILLYDYNVQLYPTCSLSRLKSAVANGSAFYDGESHEWAIRDYMAIKCENDAHGSEDVKPHALGKLLEENKDYIVTYYNESTKTKNDCTNAGIITVTVTGVGFHSGTLTGTYRIDPQALVDDNVTVGNITENSATVTVTDRQGRTLSQDVDYTVNYTKATDGRIGKITVQGIGNYSSSVTRNIEWPDDSGSSGGSGSSAAPASVTAPAPAPAEPITIAKVPASTKAKAGKKGKVTVSWKKIKKSKKTKALLGQIKSVQVQYSTDPNFAADVVTKTVSKKKTKLNLKLQKKTTYYIRVRYVGADGVSDWGAVKKVTTKK